MILFLDSSALVKLYSAEANRELVFSAIAKGRDVAVSSLSLAEVTSALKRHQLEGGFSQADEQRAFQVLLEDWETFDRIDLSDRLANRRQYWLGLKVCVVLMPCNWQVQVG